MVGCDQKIIHVFFSGFKTKMTTYLKYVELCKFVWPDVEDILTASTDKDCDINTLPDARMDRSSITAFD